MFCHILREDIFARICFDFHDGNLLPLENARALEQRPSPGFGITLTTLLQHYNLQLKDKIKLAHITALAFWQFYDTELLYRKWNSDCVVFMPEQHGDARGLPNEPYIPVQFDVADEDPEEYLSENSLIHRYPRILAFAIMLVEIGLGRPLQLWQCTSLVSQVNADFDVAYQGLDELKKSSWENFANKDVFIQAIVNCLTSDNYRPGLNEDITASTVKNPTRRHYCRESLEISQTRRSFYDKVVWPLQWLAEVGFRCDQSTSYLRADQSSLQLNFSHSISHKEDESCRRLEKMQPKRSKPSGPVAALVSIPEANDSTNDSQQNLPRNQAQLINDKALHYQPSHTQETLRPKSRDGFDVAIICALPLEADAVLSTFDHHWNIDLYGKAANDPNFYSVGVLGRRNVVLVHPPRPGKVPAANVATACAMSFTKVTLALVVGVCGGVPFKHNNEEILLGDVVISKGVIQYDHGRQYSDGFKRKIDVEESLSRPNSQLGSVLAALETKFYREEVQHAITTFLNNLGEDATPYPGRAEDRLFPPSYRHKHRSRQHCPTCADCRKNKDPVCDVALELSCQVTGCDDMRQIQRQRQNQKHQPRVHFGLIASGDSVIKSAAHRDQIAKNENVIAFEMEGAGAWDALHCVIIIKGVCDYADSHKNKLWQNYAATTAAACARAFIQYW